MINCRGARPGRKPGADTFELGAPRPEGLTITDDLDQDQLAPVGGEG